MSKLRNVFGALTVSSFHHGVQAFAALLRFVECVILVGELHQCLILLSMAALKFFISHFGDQDIQVSIVWDWAVG
jgi:hypothetical protein